MRNVWNPSGGAILPPPGIDTPAWDILLALYSDQRCELSLTKLAGIVSLSSSLLDQWLAALEDRELVTAARPGFTPDIRAVLTWRGRQLVGCCLSEAADLNVGVRH